MRKNKPIHIVVHMPNDKEVFEELYISATLNAVSQLISTLQYKRNICNEEKTAA